MAMPAKRAGFRCEMKLFYLRDVLSSCGAHIGFDAFSAYASHRDTSLPISCPSSVMSWRK